MWHAAGVDEAAGRKALLGMAADASPYITEFLGTFFLATTFGCNALGGSVVWMPTSTAFAIMVGMCAIATASGGHLNPAVSVAFGLVRKIPWSQVAGFCLAQVLGAMAAVELVARAGAGQGFVMLEVKPRNAFDWFDVLVVEVVYTTTFCFVALNCLVAKRNNPPRLGRNEFAPLAVGFVMIAGGHAALDISGAFFNPALIIGYSLPSQSKPMWCLFYLGCHCAAAVLAAVLFFMARPEELLSTLNVGGDGLGFRRTCLAVCSCCSPRQPSEGSEAEAGERAAEIDVCADGYRPAFPVRLLSEFLGTYVVVTTFGLSSCAMERLASSPHPSSSAGAAMGANGTAVGDSAGNLPADSFSVTHWATAAAVLSMVYALGNVSGGHFNPAVTLAVALSGRGHCSIMEAVFYIAAQGGAAISAAITYTCISRTSGKLNLRELGPGDGANWRTVAFGESVFTCTLVLVVLCMMTVKSPRYIKAPSTRSFHFALAIGMCVAAGGLAEERNTGGVLNPAIALGMSAGCALNSGFDHTRRLFAFLQYCLWQCVGGVAATVLFVIAHPLEYERDPLIAGLPAPCA